jgi:hypothetical protein
MARSVLTERPEADAPLAREDTTPVTACVRAQGIEGIPPCRRRSALSRPERVSWNDVAKRYAV